MPGEIATYLLGAQGGAEDDFARLYEATNPVLVRYLRVTVDADPADLALGAWATAVDQLMVCPPDDDAWLELVVGSARVAAGDSLRATGTSSSADTHCADPDDVDHAIEALRACPPEEADVLAMGLVANLDRDATSRLTGHEPGAVLALVRTGQERLEMSIEELIAALRAPGRPDEVADLWLVSPLITAALTGPAPTVASAKDMVPTPTVLTAAVAATGGRAESSVAAPAEPSVADLLGLESTAPAASNVVQLTAVRSATGTPSRSARVGAGAAAWLIAVGGVGTAAAMSGLLTAAVDAVLGDDEGRPQITAQGPVRPGATPTDGGATAGNPPLEPGSGNRPDGPTQPGTTPPGSLPGGSTVGEIVLVSYVVPDRSTPTTPIGTPTGTPTTPTTPPGQPLVPRPGSGARPVVVAGNGTANGKAKVKSQVKGNAVAKAAAKAKAVAKAAAKAAVKAAAKAEAAAKAKGKALGHDKGHDKGKAIGHGKTKA